MDTLGEIIEDKAKDEMDEHIKELNRLALLIEPNPRIFELLQELTGIIDNG